MNKLLVVSGGTRGIGRSIIDQFAVKNFDIITCARNTDQLETTKSQVKESFPEIIIDTFRADLSDRDQTQEFIHFINEKNRVVDVLVNNSGIFYPGQVYNEPDGVLEKSMETNLFSAYRITRGVLPGMMKRKKGSIFNICSVASIEPYVRGASYCMSKFALLGMTKVLREEMKDFGIKVTAVIPGSTLTSTWEGVDIPEEDFMKPGDVAKSIFDVYSISKNTVVEEIIMRPQKGDV